MTGVLNLYKPKGITSFQAVSRVKKIFGVKAVGHMGTLDPLAEGVLVIGIGKATRLFDYYLSKDKKYVAEFTFGYETDTLDSEGKILLDGGRIPTESEITECLSVEKKLIGKISQMPPKYSAKNVCGRRAFDLARQGVEFELKPSEITVYGIELIAAQSPKFTFEIRCSAGTYIRSICRDLAGALQTLGTMTALRRTQAGNFLIEDSITFEQLEDVKEKALISIPSALSDLKRLDVDAAMYKQLSNGVPIREDNNGVFSVFCADEFFGIGKVDNGLLKITTYLRE